MNIFNVTFRAVRESIHLIGVSRDERHFLMTFKYPWRMGPGASIRPYKAVVSPSGFAGAANPFEVTNIIIFIVDFIIVYTMSHLICDITIV